MSRTFWFAAGAVTGAYTLVKARRAAENLTPDGIGARVAALGVGVRLFADEVAAGMAEREAQLREQLQLPTAMAPQIPVPPILEQQGVGRSDGHR